MTRPLDVEPLERCPCCNGTGWQTFPCPTCQPNGVAGDPAVCVICHRVPPQFCAVCREAYAVDRLRGELAQRRAVCASPRLLELAKVAAFRQHASAVTRMFFEDGVDTGHDYDVDRFVFPRDNLLAFAECSHPDCVLVRAALTPASHQQEQEQSERVCDQCGAKSSDYGNWQGERCPSLPFGSCDGTMRSVAGLPSAQEPAIEPTYARAIVRRVAAYVRGFYPPPSVQRGPDSARSEWQVLQHVAEMIEAQEHALLQDVIAKSASSSPAQEPAAARNEWRLDERGLLDDVVVDKVETFRLERMSDDQVWGAVYHHDGSRTVFNLFGDRLSLDYEHEALPASPRPGGEEK